MRKKWRIQVFLGFAAFFCAPICLADMPIMDENSDAYQTAQRVLEKHQSAEVQNKIRSEVTRLTPRIAKQKAEIFREASKKQRKAGQSSKSEILIFISASMPNDSIAEFARSAQNINEKCIIQFILKGFPKRGLDQFINDIQGDQFMLNLNIDPFLFEAFEVESVPVLVVNREYLVKHPSSLQDAFATIQEQSSHDFTDLMRYLSN